MIIAKKLDKTEPALSETSQDAFLRNACGKVDLQEKGNERENLEYQVLF